MKLKIDLSLEGDPEFNYDFHSYEVTGPEDSLRKLMESINKSVAVTLAAAKDIEVSHTELPY
ncbi:MAG: hypothetical protein ABIN18_17395 [Pseudomonadota bacterium]